MANTRKRAAAKVSETQEMEEHEAENNGIENGTNDNGNGSLEVQAEIHQPPPENRVDPKPKGRKKATPKKKTAPRQTAPKANEIRDFMRQQAEINSSILTQLKQLNEDKCAKSVIAQGTGGQVNESRKVGKQPRSGSGKAVYSQSSSDSESDDSDFDNESTIRRDISDANAMLQTRFNKTTGKQKSAKRLEKEIKANRPYAFLDRDVQRKLNRENIHPEELGLMHHLEGMIGMVSAQCTEYRTKAMLNHIYQVAKDSQVHSWTKVRAGRTRL